MQLLIEPFEEATKEFSSQCYPSLLKVIPMVHLLLSSMEGDLSEISEEMTSSISVSWIIEEWLSVKLTNSFR